MKAFNDEKKFEDAVVELLKLKGWQDVINRPTEEVLIKNWADILFKNNRASERLNDCPLTASEMRQILSQIRGQSPYKLNGWINGKTISIKRDNPDDKRNFGNEISLKIYDRNEIKAGLSRYQIARQPIFKGENDQTRRADLMLLINGMPVIHIELKNSNVPCIEACNQLQRYAKDGMFTNLFALVQVFVAMTPEESVYFANPGACERFNPDFYFHWANFNNEIINDWKDFTEDLLNIPMAHELIGFYTVPDEEEAQLKVLRSYQYYAVKKITDRVFSNNWHREKQLGGYIWHTTGSGKTMTSFKAAQLIANSNDADKVIFLMDRIELSTQSFDEYRNFANDDDDIQNTKNTADLIKKLKSSKKEDKLIVTSIQKLSRIKKDTAAKTLKAVAVIQQKRLVIIVDECHRSTFGDMLADIKGTFPRAVFFGFTGTPIQEENSRKDTTTSMIFGDELHRYSITDGIRDKNVLGFDRYKVLTYKDIDLRKAVALEMSKAKTEDEALKDEKKKEVYLEYMEKIPMAADPSSGKEGIEDHIRNVQYQRDEHRSKVVLDIKNNWTRLSRNGKYHALLAVSSIHEAILYWRLLREEMPNLKVTVLVDPTIDNTGDKVLDKQDGLNEVLEYCNNTYGRNWSLQNYPSYKKDLAKRLAHKKPYERITAKDQVDMVIVVNQLLTGFDSKWINTLYIDKLIKYEFLIQAFSRTNRLCDKHDKPHGTIRYYRKPHTMEKNIERAMKLYSGEEPLGLFVDCLIENLCNINLKYEEITNIFNEDKIKDFRTLPKDVGAKKKFARAFNEMNKYIDAAKIQGFTWEKTKYTNEREDYLLTTSQPDEVSAEEADQVEDNAIEVKLTKEVYDTLLQRYKELGTHTPETPPDIPYELDTYIIEIGMGKIDYDYMNSRFKKYLKVLTQEGVSEEEIEEAFNKLHQSFARLPQTQQKYAEKFLLDIKTGSLKVDFSRPFSEYVNDYINKGFNAQIHRLCEVFGLDEVQLSELMKAGTTEKNLDEYGRFEKLIKSMDTEKAISYMKAKEGVDVKAFSARAKARNIIRSFILSGGFDIDNPSDS